MNEALAIRALRLFIREEVGRSFRSADTTPYSWQDYPESEVEIYPSRASVGPDDDMIYNVKITCKFDPSLSVPLSTFKEESEAKEFARQHAERLHREYLSQDPQFDSPIVVD